MREKWLHGWPRTGISSVLIGPGIHCVGCGASRGVTCVVLEEGYESLTKLPDWPFEEATCPVCELERSYKLRDTEEDKLTARLLALKEKER